MYYLLRRLNLARNDGKGLRLVHQNARFAPPVRLETRRHPSGLLSEDLVIISMRLTTCIAEERGSLKSTIGIRTNDVLKKILVLLSTCAFKKMEIALIIFSATEL